MCRQAETPADAEPAAAEETPADADEKVAGDDEGKPLADAELAAVGDDPENASGPSAIAVPVIPSS